MASALAFIGGGLLQGVGKGLVESGKEKRERALADLETRLQAQRDERLQEGREGLLGTRIDANETAAEKADVNAKSAAELTASARVTASKTAAGKATTAADVQNAREIAAAELRATNAQKVAKIRGGKSKDRSAEADRIIERHSDGVDELTGAPIIRREEAAQSLDAAGLHKEAAQQRRIAKGVKNREKRSAAEDKANAEADDRESIFPGDDFDGLTREKWVGNRVNVLLDEPPTATRQAATAPPAATPEATATGPYVGDAPPPGFPDAKRAKDGFWYVKRDGKTLRVTGSVANRPPPGGQGPR